MPWSSTCTNTRYISEKLSNICLINLYVRCNPINLLPAGFINFMGYTENVNDVSYGLMIWNQPKISWSRTCTNTRHNAEKHAIVRLMTSYVYYNHIHPVTNGFWDFIGSMEAVTNRLYGLILWNQLNMS